MTGTKGTYGNGAITSVNPANSAVAPTVPRVLYIAPANKGKPAAKQLRIALLAASALAENWRYATTRYVKLLVDAKYTRVPNGTLATIGTA